MKAGATISLILLFLYIGLNKSISILNKLMLHLQFFAYITQWQISYTEFTETCLLEIKRIVLCEYFDDFGLS